jgi:hypothetical protein
MVLANRNVHRQDLIGLFSILRVRLTRSLSDLEKVIVLVKLEVVVHRCEVMISE